MSTKNQNKAKPNPESFMILFIVWLHRTIRGDQSNSTGQTWLPAGHSPALSSSSGCTCLFSASVLALPIKREGLPLGSVCGNLSLLPRIEVTQAKVLRKFSTVCLFSLSLLLGFLRQGLYVAHTGLELVIPPAPLSKVLGL